MKQLLERTKISALQPGSAADYDVTGTKIMSNKNVHTWHLHICSIDFFPDECRENAEEECSEFRVEVPLSAEFNSTVFEHYCR